MSSNAVRREGPRGRGKFTTSGTSPACKGPCRAEQACGIWLLEYLSPPQAPARPLQDQVLRWSSTSGCYAHACLRNYRVVGHLLTDGMNPLRGRKLPACLHAKLDTTARKPECAAYPAQMLKLRRTHEFSRPSIPPVRGFTDGHRQTQTTVQQPSRRTARSRCRTAFDLAGWYTPGPRPATPGRRSSSDTLTPTAARRCSTGCLSCARATSSPSPAPTAHRYALSSSAPSSIQGPVPDRRRLLPHPDAHSAAGDLRRGIRPRHGHYRSNVIFFATMAP